MITGLESFRSFALVAYGIPESIIQAVTAPGQNIPRHEWNLYTAIKRKIKNSERLPSFGDYVIEHPNFVERDMRFTKPLGKLIYTSGNNWLVRKGPNVRDYGYGQYVDHTAAIVVGGRFAGESYSEGDKHIAKCSRREINTGNLTMSSTFIVRTSP